MGEGLTCGSNSWLIPNIVSPAASPLSTLVSPLTTPMPVFGDSLYTVTGSAAAAVIEGRRAASKAIDSTPVLRCSAADSVAAGRGTALSTRADPGSFRNLSSFLYYRYNTIIIIQL